MYRAQAKASVRLIATSISSVSKMNPIMAQLRAHRSIRKSQNKAQDNHMAQETYVESALSLGIDAYDAAFQDYRAVGTKDSSSSQEMRALVGMESRPHMRKFQTVRGPLTR